MGKEENAGYQRFLLFQLCFHNVFIRLLSQGRKNHGLFGKGSTELQGL